MKLISNTIKGTLQFAAVALVVAVSVAMPQAASANTGAGATILNVVTVSYQDAGATTSYAETATSSVTVDLVPSAPNVSAPADATVASGGTATYTYTVTATANGTNTYPITTTPGATTNATGEAATPSVASLTLGASVITANTPTTVTIPAGSDTDLNIGDIVVVGGVDYEISAISANNIASHVNTPGDGNAGVTTPEVPVTITLIANAAGSNTVPAFGALPLGAIIGEQQTFTVDVTADAGPGPGDGSVPVTTTVGTGPDDTPDTTTTTFSGPDISITKQVSTDGGLTFAASGNGAPGDTLTYRITVTNAGVGNATSVVVTDPMPLYTTYTAGTAKSNTTVTTYTDVGNTVLTDAVDGPEPYDFTGTTATLDVGTLAGGATSVLFYQVTID